MIKELTFYLLPSTRRIHVTPTDDAIEHDKRGTRCVCGPGVEEIRIRHRLRRWLIVHNSLDGRELAE